MSLRTALPAKPSAGVLPCVLLASLGGLVGLTHCTDPRPEVIARSQDTGTDGATGSSDASAAGDTGDASDADSAAPAMIPAQRGRVKVVAGNLVTDIGTPLRGILLPVDTGWTLDNYDFNLVTTIAHTTGLNTLHVYLEDSGQVTGSMENEADALVSLTAQSGMYLIIGIGTGAALNTFSSSKVHDFWTLYSARYANNPHVIFEIQNNPEPTCDKPVQAATLTMELDTYQLIRSFAPNSHIMLFSTSSLIQPSVLTDAITRVGSKVDWSNASFVMDVTPTTCLKLSSLSQLTDVAKAQSVPLLIGQLPAVMTGQTPQTSWGPYLTAFEQAQLGWMQYQYFANDALLADYITGTTSADVTWCPDQGAFPQDSNTCR